MRSFEKLVVSQSLFENLPVFFCCVDALTGEVTFANNSALGKLQISVQPGDPTKIWDAPCWSNHLIMRDRVLRAWETVRNGKAEAYVIEYFNRDFRETLRFVPVNKGTIAVHAAERIHQKTDVKKFDLRQALKGLRVLVVDDIFDNQFILNTFLTRAGAVTEVADNGEEAIQAALGKSYDAILMDISLPIINGLEASQILRLKGFKKPIIAVTAHAMTVERNEAINAGCTDYIAKPVGCNELIQMFQKHVVWGEAS